MSGAVTDVVSSAMDFPRMIRPRRGCRQRNGAHMRTLHLTCCRAGYSARGHAGRRPRATWCWSARSTSRSRHGTRLAVMLVDMTQHLAGGLTPRNRFSCRTAGGKDRCPRQPKFHDANIDSENISFSCPRPSLCAGSLQFAYRRGQRVGLAGSSGAGKSAVLMLLHVGRSASRLAGAPVGQDSVQINNPACCSRCFACSLRYSRSSTSESAL